MRRTRWTVLVAGSLMGAVALWAQGQGGGGGQSGGDSGDSGGSGGSGGTTRGSGGTTGQNQSQSQSQGSYGNTGRQNDPFGQSQDPFGARQNRPLYLNGRVVTADGQPPMEPVVVQRVCPEGNFPEGYTDSKGRFSFQVGGDISMLTTDASVSGFGVGPIGPGGTYTTAGIRQVGPGRFDLSSCVLRAELSGYRSEDVQLGMYSSMGSNDVGMIVLRRLDGLVGNVVSALTLQAPKGAQRAYQSGLREMRKKKPNFKKGVTQFEKAVREFPRFAAAWAAMGDAKLGLKDTAGAREAFSKAVEADPDYLKPYEPLIRMAVEQSAWADMESLGDAYLKLNPKATNVQFLTAVAALNTGKHERAEQMVQAMRAGESSERYPQSYQIMGMIHEQRAEFSKAAHQYRTFVEVSAEPQSPNVEQVKRKLHEWEMLGVIESKSAFDP